MNEDFITRAEQEVRSRNIHNCPACNSVMRLVTSSFSITRPLAKRTLAFTCSDPHCGVRGPFSVIHKNTTASKHDAQLKAYKNWFKMVENVCKEFSKPPRERHKKITPPKKKAKE